MLKPLIILVLTLAGAITLIACGGGEKGEGAAPPPATQHEHEGGGTVHVALKEWSITEAGSGASSFATEAGDVIFEVHNDGAAPHDLLVIKTALAADALPVVDGSVDAEAAGEVIGGLDQFPGGEIRVKPYELEPGHYVLICSIPGHYEQGMYAEQTIE